ncbi:reverse transcriptase domain-containing protein [Tanacetum coccineum]
MEKLVLALVFTAKRLRRYFQAHPIVVITDQPIKQIILLPDVAERLQKWSVMLGEHNIMYRPGTSVKGHILADFLIEKPDEAPPNTLVVEIPQVSWTLFTDGSSCVDGSGAGLILTSPKGTEFTYALRFQFIASNNEAEYEALIAGLRIAAQMGVRNVHVGVDSKLVANQVLGTYVAKEENMVKYLEKSKSLISCFTNFSISQVPRSKNKKADALSKIESTSFAHLSKQVLVEVLKEKSIQEKEVATVKASKLRIKARQYELLKGVLYRRSFLKPWLRKGQVFDSRYRLFHEVDRDESRGDNHRQLGEEVHVGQHMKHPQSNGLVERANQSLGEGIKARLGEGNKNWIEELAHVLWAHRNRLPSEIEMPTYRIAVVDAIHNNEELRLNLDLLEERRERAAIREARAKLKMTKHYNVRVRGVTFRPGDFVYHSNEASHAMDRGKLGPKWEGPYEVTKTLRDGAYRLRSMDGTVLSRT